jgi:hypothetical protein
MENGYFVCAIIEPRHKRDQPTNQVASFHLRTNG